MPQNPRQGQKSRGQEWPITGHQRSWGDFPVIALNGSFAPPLICPFMEWDMPPRTGRVVQFSCSAVPSTRGGCCARGWWRASGCCSCLRRDTWAWGSSGERQEAERFWGSTGGKTWWVAAGFSLGGKGASLQGAVPGWAGKV